jgi:hypothetical protein
MTQHRSIIVVVPSFPFKTFATPLLITGAIDRERKRSRFSSVGRTKCQALFPSSSSFDKKDNTLT